MTVNVLINAQMIWYKDVFNFRENNNGAICMLFKNVKIDGKTKHNFSRINPTTWAICQVVPTPGAL